MNQGYFTTASSGPTTITDDMVPEDNILAKALADIGGIPNTSLSPISDNEKKPPLTPIKKSLAKRSSCPSTRMEKHKKNGEQWEELEADSCCNNQQLLKYSLRKHPRSRCPGNQSQ